MDQKKEPIVKDPQLFFSAIESAQDGLLLTDTKGAILYANQTALALFQYSQGDLRTRKLQDLIANPDTYKDMVQETKNKGAWLGEIFIKNKKSEKALLILSLSLIKDSNGKCIGMISVFRSVTDLIQQRKKLKEHSTLIETLEQGNVEEIKSFEHRYYQLFEAANEGILILDSKTGTILDANKHLSDILGYPKSFLLGKQFANIEPFAHVSEFKNAFLETKEKGSIHYENFPIHSQQGTLLEIEVYGTLCKIDHTSVVRIDIRDVTARIKAEQKLQDSDARLKTLFEDSREGLLVADIDSKQFIMCNKAICHMLGYTEEELKKLSVRDIHPKEAVEKVLSIFENQAKGDFKTAEGLLVQRKDGSIFYADVNTSPLFFEGKKYLLGSFRDSSEREHLLELKNNFINMVAHEVRTPLGVIQEASSLVLDGIAGPMNDQQIELLSLVKKNIDRLSRLINQVLTIQRFEAGKVEFQLRENDINAAMQEVYLTVLPLIRKKKLAFNLELDKTIPRFSFDFDMITQATLNIVNNAHRNTDQGSITIKTAQEENMIQVSVIDSGAGIKKEDIPKVFERFFRIDLKRSGTGLGLSISKEIIEAHKGKIWCESEIGKGSTFHFVLPVIHGEDTHD